MRKVVYRSSSQPNRYNPMMLLRTMPGAALGRFRHEALPPGLEGRARHAAVLNGKCGEQRKIHRQCMAQCRGGYAIQAGRRQEAADEADSVEKYSEKDQVTYNPVAKDSDARHELLPYFVNRLVVKSKKSAER